MADRQDIDALLVGAVYGELDAAERARLDAHLSSHPEDRAELESLEHTRAQVRRSIAALPEAEPSPSGLSTLLEAASGALLLKAAAGGVPAAKPAVEPEEVGLWARFVAWLVPVTRHPAFGAAAVLVLVAGVASAWWLSGGKVAEPEVKSTAAGSSNAPVMGSASGSGSASASGSAVAAAPMDPSNSYRVDLADDSRAGADQQAQQQAAESSARDHRGAEKAPAPKATSTASASGKASGGGSAPMAKKTAGVNNGYMEVQTDGDKIDIKSANDDGAADTGVGGETINAGAGSVAGAAEPQPAPPPAVSGGNGEPMDPKLLQWAETQRAQLLQYVKKGNCPEAGRIGADIKDKAPEYYAQYIANDRAVRQCEAYIQGDAKKKAAKDYKSRAQTNTVDQESPAAN